MVTQNLHNNDQKYDVPNNKYEISIYAEFQNSSTFVLNVVYSKLPKLA